MRIPCKLCGKLFQKWSNQVYCSDECKQETAALRVRKKRIKNKTKPHPCETCGTMVYRLKQRWCGQDCIPVDNEDKYRSDNFRAAVAMRLFPGIQDDIQRLKSAWVAQKGAEAR